ncbi:MAG TPA: hypothetical protein VGK37_12410 [Casimicrobiaceae bacterium]|jgi:hypothetical protein
MKSVLDPTFRYTPSIHTDLRKTFARLKREARAEAAQRDDIRPPASNVAVLFTEPKLAHK